MKNKSKAIALSIILATGLAGVSLSTTASACPGRRVIVKKCWNNGWRRQCRIVRRHRGCRHWRRHHRYYPPVFVNPQVRFGWGIQVG